MAAQALRRPYRVPLTLVLLAALVPLYIILPELLPPPVRHRPELAIDRTLPLVPVWALGYGTLYLFLILLPLLVVREDDLIRRMAHAYLLIWIAAYLFFFVFYPTAAPRPLTVSAGGFGAWGLKALYSADPPINCFPSLHVAHSFVSAFAAGRVNRRLGRVAVICAALVALSTLFTKQHYVVDVIGGIALAFVAYVTFLAKYPRERVPEVDRRAAPALAFCLAGVAALVLAASWVVYVASEFV